ncbi:MAG: hypothetical protein IJH64_06295 [Oscillospiraceae bacterium]|nr:hypothetical protein [Oscillospiraceae bacterium]
MTNQTVFEKMRNKKIPDYYDGMYLDGYKPYEILEAAHNSIIKQYTERQQEAEAEPTPDEPPMNVRFQVEVKKK